MIGAAPPCRAPDWPTRLAYWHGLQLSAPPVFAWGRVDCVLWAASWVEEAVGRSYANGLAGTYEDAFGARRILRRRLKARGGEPARGAPLHELLGQLLDHHFPRRGLVLEAQRGDLVMAQTLGLPARPAGLGVCLGRVVLCLGLQRGTVEVPLADSLIAWRL